MYSLVYRVCTIFECYYFVAIVSGWLIGLTSPKLHMLVIRGLSWSENGRSTMVYTWQKRAELL